MISWNLTMKIIVLPFNGVGVTTLVKLAISASSSAEIGTMGSTRQILGVSWSVVFLVISLGSGSWV